VTVNTLLLVADPEGVVTRMGPVVAALGTVVVSAVAVADSTGAGLPLKVTAFWEAVGLRPVPARVTAVPAGPRSGENSMRDTADEGARPMEMRFPTAS
jgi:hypothetical protein